MKLNLGSFNTKIEGFLNVDMQDLPGVDIKASIDNLSFAKDGEVEAIICSHALEHFSYYKTIDVLKEWNRVLVPGGMLYVAVPDIMAVMDWILSYGWGVWQERLMFGDQDYDFGLHRSGFDYEYLKGYLEKAGFDQIYKADKFPLDIQGKTAMDINFPDHLNEKGRSGKLSLNVIARKGVA